jgi:hypothetical protein
MVKEDKGALKGVKGQIYQCEISVEKHERELVRQTRNL